MNKQSLHKCLTKQLEIRQGALYKIVMFITFFSIINSTSAANYFINSRIGDDSNSGTSKEAVWKTLKNLEQNIFKPGDSILFAKGSAYTGGFTFTSFGTAGKTNCIF